MVETENVLIKAVLIERKLCMEPCVYFLLFISPIVWNMCEHLHYTLSL